MRSSETALSRPRRANLVLLLVSTSITLVAFEGLARIFLSAPLPWRFPQVRYRSDDQLIFGLLPDQQAFTADKEAEINARGLRGRLVPWEREPGRLRVLLLGDSIAFGYGVAESEAVAGRLAARLLEHGVSAEVINAGVPSYNVEQEVAYLVSEGIRYQPDWVILAVCWNDLNEKSGVRVTPEGWLASPGEKQAGALVTMAESPTGYTLRNAIKRSRLLYAAAQGWRGASSALWPDDHWQFREDILAGRDSPRVARGWERMESSLQALARQQRESGFKVLVVTFPLLAALERDDPTSSYPTRVLSLAAAAGLPAKDLTPSYRAVFRGHDSLFIPYDADHPNARGHDLAAAEITAVLMEAPADGTSD